jgi:hypothetical protein
MMIHQLIHRPFYRNEDDPMGGSEQSYEFSGDQEEPESSPEFVTRQDLEAFADGIAQGISKLQSQGNYYDPHEYSESEHYEPDDYEIEEDALYDPGALSEHLRMRDQHLTQNIMANLMPMMAPAVAQSAANAISSDLDRDSQNYIYEKLSGLDPQAIQVVVQDPNTRELLRDAAQLHAMRRQGDSIPGASGVAPSMHRNGVQGQEIESFMKAFGVSKQRATEIFNKALKENR